MMINRLLVLMISALGIGLFSLGTVYAQDPACAAGGPLVGTSYCNNQSTSSDATNNQFLGNNDSILSKIVFLLITITGVISVIMVVIGGIMYAVSNGEPQKANKARDTIIYGLVGAVVALLARQIVIFALNRL